MKPGNERTIGKSFHFNVEFGKNALRLGSVNLKQIGELCCERGFRIEDHEQSVYEVTYVISGRGVSYVDGRRIDLREGDVLLNATGHIHALEATETDIFRYAYMGFLFSGEGGDAVAALQRVFDSCPWRLTHDSNGSMLLPFMRCIDELYAQTACSTLMVKNYCEQIVTMAARDFLDSRSVVPHTEQVIRADGATVYAVIRYIEENIYSMGTIRDMAGELGYSATYLSHLFKERTGTTLQSYIHYKRIECATQLLHCGGLTISQVASRLGYESVQAFSKSFRRIMGVSPTQYLQAEKNTQTVPEVSAAESVPTA